MNNFPRFWFESNLYFGWVENLDDLNKVFEQWEGQMTKDEILDKAVDFPDGNFKEFGLRTEHTGNVTLRQFLEEKGVDYGKK
jgi:hypothetical protein